jgi:aclacinomycin oxidase
MQTDSRIFRQDTPIRLGPDDTRYREIIDRRFNKRFAGRPEYICVVRRRDEVIGALSEAVRHERRVAVTSGGHCLEGFVSDPSVQVLIDISTMKRVYFDSERAAIAVEGGATVGEVLQALFDSWHTVLPLGEYPQIGLGGHVVGGAFGFLCRQHGLAADHLYAVEMVTVAEDGSAECVTATREPTDPYRDLWWAHTGGGGGNFGVVTKYWFRSPNAPGSEPATLLPRAPDSITTLHAEWKWADIDRSTFVGLLTNCGTWAEHNSRSGDSGASIFTLLIAHRRELEKIVVRGVCESSAERQLIEYLKALSDGVPMTRPQLARMTWLEFALNPFPDLFASPPGGVRTKVKDAQHDGTRETCSGMLSPSAEIEYVRIHGRCRLLDLCGLQTSGKLVRTEDDAGRHGIRIDEFE